MCTSGWGPWGPVQEWACHRRIKNNRRINNNYVIFQPRKPMKGGKGRVSWDERLEEVHPGRRLKEEGK